VFRGAVFDAVFGSAFFEFEEFRAELFWGPALTRETTSPAKDRMVETKNEKSRKR